MKLVVSESRRLILVEPKFLWYRHLAIPSAMNILAKPLSGIQFHGKTVQQPSSVCCICFLKEEFFENARNHRIISGAQCRLQGMRNIHVMGRYFRFVAILKIIVSSENHVNIGLLAYCGNWGTSKGDLCFGDTWHNLDVEGVHVR